MQGGYFSGDTIAAIATNLAGDAGVGIIRISGSRSLQVAKLICSDFESPEPRYLHRIEIREFDSAGSDETLDDGLAAYFPEGQSFTGEDIVELQIHGGRFQLQAVLNLVLRTGLCRMALPGEFSFRAVRNGKMSLSAAEAVRQQIHAKSAFEARAARRNIGLSREKEIRAIADRILNLLAQTELSIDFTDQDVEVVSKNQLNEELRGILGQIELLWKRLSMAQRLAQGVGVTIAGAANAGKSTVFNALLAEDRAIVSPEAGTTRDIITEELRIGQYLVRLADTAGFRENAGAIEGDGIARAHALVGESDIVVTLVDASLPEFELGKEIKAGIMRTPAGAGCVVVLNKWDLLTQSQAKLCMAAAETVLKEASRDANLIALSCITHDGIEGLLTAICREMDERFKQARDVFLPTEFQMQMLLGCRKSLKEALEVALASGLERPEILASSLRGAMRSLSDMAGETTPDTVLAKIFSEFCIGK